MSRDRGPLRLAVDWQACDARGLCAELRPEAVTLDDWGYPLVSEVPRRAAGPAREAVRSCPTRALRLHD